MSVVHENSATTAHLVLPPSPMLTEAEMEFAAGAGDWDEWLEPGPGA